MLSNLTRRSGSLRGVAFRRYLAAQPDPAEPSRPATDGDRQGRRRAGGTSWAAVVAAVKGTVFEAMAATVPARDRAFFAQRWGFVLPDATPKSEATDTTAAGSDQQPAVGRSRSPLAATGVPEAAAMNHVDDAPEERSTISRPNFEAVVGVPVVDLGYKQVVRASLAEMVTVPIWEKQRILRPDRSRHIAKAKLAGVARGEVAGLPGVITLYHNRATGATGILDGQHRLGALMLLCEEGEWERSVRNILVDVFRVSGPQDVKDLFTEINSAEPVRLVDMPTEGVDEVLKAVLNEAVEALEEAHPAMFKASHRCRPPHLNKDNLRDEIYQAEFMPRRSIMTTAQLLAALSEVNERLGTRRVEEWTEENSRLSPKKASFPDALAKASTHGFYLGLDAAWART